MNKHVTQQDGGFDYILKSLTNSAANMDAISASSPLVYGSITQFEAAAVERRRVVLRGLSQIHLSERGNRPGKAPGLDISTEGAKAEAFPPSPRI
jgi:hypothetical protein